jgi:hypothetical protein
MTELNYSGIEKERGQALKYKLLMMEKLIIRDPTLRP